MQRTELASLYKATPADGTKVTVCGWAKTVRDSKNIGFISLSDGSCYKPVQIVFQADKLANYAEIAKCGLYTSFEVTGSVVVTPGAKQPFEINADEITVLGPCGGDYPLQKKKMGMDYLRTMTHLRPRTNTFNAAFRVRGQAAFALHQFFHEHGFTYVHTPIFTGSDCEGAGEMFQVTTLDLNDIPRNDEGGVDYTKDFFKRPVNLTVSGQLEAEAMAMAFGKVYTFGPTFRAEKSFTTRHAAEFWMIEPEMAFCDLNGYMDNAEAMIKYIIRYVMEHCPDEMNFFNSFVDKGLLERLNALRRQIAAPLEELRRNRSKTGRGQAIALYRFLETIGLPARLEERTGALRDRGEAALAEEYGVAYLNSDFKKKNGYKRSVELSEQYGMYRQYYCGCVFSKNQHISFYFYYMDT